MEFPFLDGDLDNYEITVQNGKLMYQGKILDTQELEEIHCKDIIEESNKPNKLRFMFLLHPNGRLYGALERQNSKQYKHSSLLGEEWPLMAGKMRTNSKGELDVITIKSGHFVPDQEGYLYLMRDYLEARGVNTTHALSGKKLDKIFKVLSTSKENIRQRFGRALNFATPSRFFNYIKNQGFMVSRCKRKAPLSPVEQSQDSRKNKRQRRV